MPAWRRRRRRAARASGVGRHATASGRPRSDLDSILSSNLRPTRRRTSDREGRARAARLPRRVAPRGVGGGGRARTARRPQADPSRQPRTDALAPAWPPGGAPLGARGRARELHAAWSSDSRSASPCRTFHERAGCHGALQRMMARRSRAASEHGRGVAAQSPSVERTYARAAAASAARERRPRAHGGGGRCFRRTERRSRWSSEQAPSSSTRSRRAMAKARR